jgi:hypothetical protein
LPKALDNGVEHDEPSNFISNDDNNAETTNQADLAELKIGELLAHGGGPSHKTSEEVGSGNIGSPKETLSGDEPLHKTSSIVDQLARFAELRANGTLTEEEFNELKANLIGPLPKKPLPIIVYIERLRAARDSGAIADDEFQSKVLASLMDANAK